MRSRVFRRIVVAFLVMAAFNVAWGAEAFRVERRADRIAGAAVRDAKHKRGKCVEVWLEKKGATVDFGRVPAGCYRVSVRGRFLGVPNVRYSVSAAATVGDAAVGGREFRANAMPADGQYHTVTFDARVRRAGTMTLALSLRDHAREEDAKAVAESKLRGMAAPKIGEKDELDGLEADLEVLPPPAGTESFLVTSASIVREPRPLAVTKVRSDKINYFPGDKVTVDVDVTNVADADARGTLVVELIRGIDRTKQLLREPVEAAEGKTVSRSVTFDADEEYGYEVHARIVADGQKDGDALSGYFSVSKNVFEVSIQGWGRVGVLNDQESMRNLLTMPQEELDERSRQSALSLRRNYYNHVEFFSWAPDDFFNLAPKKDVWWSGTMTYIKVKRDILAEIRALQKQGIKVLSYAQPYAIGLDTVKNLRTNPEFFAYYGNGSPAVGYDYDLIKSRARTDMGLRPAEIGGGLNFFDLRTVDRGIDVMIASWKMFGWDGVRYDNRYYRANNPITYTGERATTEKNLDPYSARNVKRQKERFWKEIGPRWLISHNNGYRFHTEGNKLGWEETVKDGLMCMDEETCNANSPSSNLNPWINYFRFALEARRFCTQLGGYYQLFPPGRGTTTASDMLYYVVSCAATGSHPISCDVSGSAGGNYGRFMTRYSAMIWARDLKPLEAPEKYLTVAPAEESAVWWKEFANTRVSHGKRWLLFPIVIRPADPRIGQDPGSKIAKPPSSIGLTLSAEAFAAAPRAFLLTPERERMCVPLELKKEGAGYGVSLPRIAQFGLLVVETEEK